MVCRDDTLGARLFSKARKTETCWWWTGAKDEDGYGEIGFSGGMRSTHRAAYELVNGPIPHGLVVRHTCDNPSCINPAHLITGAAIDNVRDMMTRGRQASRAGQLNGAAKVGEISVRAIRASSLPTGDLADIFGLGPRAIQNIRNRTTWKHL